jgi:predicted dehydrogenase
MIDVFDFQGVYDKDQTRAETVATELKCQPFETLKAVLESCDAVSVATPTSNHCEITLQAIEAGKHVLVEKPIAATLDEADRMIAAAEAAGIQLMVGHIERFNPALAALSNHDIRPSFIEAHRLAAFNPRGADVAVVLDLMIHDIDLALYLVKSRVRDISASAVAVVSDSVDIANARLTFDNGAVANLTASRISLKPMRKLRIFQSSGYFSLDLADKKADLYRLLESGPMDGESSIPLGSSGKNIGYMKAGDASVDMLGAELKAFAAAIREDRPVPITGHEGREALAVALAIIDESQKASKALVDHER